jgi:hypothetical protein
MSKVFLNSSESVAANIENLRVAITNQSLPAVMVEQLGGLVVLPTANVGSKVFAVTRHSEGSYGIYVSLSGTCVDGVIVPSQEKNYNFSLKGWLNLSQSAEEGQATMVINDKQVEALEAWLAAPKGEKPNLFIDFSGNPIILMLTLEEQQKYVLDTAGNKVQVGVKTDGTPAYQLESYQAICFSAGYTKGTLAGNGTGSKGLSLADIDAALARFAALTK